MAVIRSSPMSLDSSFNSPSPHDPLVSLDSTSSSSNSTSHRRHPYAPSPPSSSLTIQPSPHSPIHDSPPFSSSSSSSSSSYFHSSSYKSVHRQTVSSKRPRGQAEMPRLSANRSFSDIDSAAPLSPGGSSNQISVTSNEPISNSPCCSLLIPWKKPGTCLTSRPNQKLPCVNNCPVVATTNNDRDEANSSYKCKKAASTFASPSATECSSKTSYTGEIECLSSSDSWHSPYHSNSSLSHSSHISSSMLDSTSSSSYFPSSPSSVLSSSQALSSSSPSSSSHRPNSFQIFFRKVTSFEFSLLIPPVRAKDSISPSWSTHTHAHSRPRGRQLGLTLLLLFLQLLVQTTPSHAQVVGEHMRCHQEGKAVAVPKEVFKDNPCLECICENGIVVCNKKRCPSMEGCYWKLFDSLGKCCQECKGCDHEGKMYKHGSRWSDGCSNYECLSGVLTVSQAQCHIPCYATLPLEEKQCCQRCQSCWFEGRRVPEGESVASKTDPCILCKCSSGKLSCENKVCPVLSCPPSKQVASPESCCKTCEGSRDLISPPGGRCFLNSHLYQTGDDRSIDSCTRCTCHNGYITCQRRTCPVVNCSPEFQMVLENECCPTCSAAPELDKVCWVLGMVWKDQEEWQMDKCTSCKCENGETTCHMITCEYSNKPCPAGYRRIESENECCPRCEESPGVCVVFGDPHYHTFDGMLFNFQGACKYTLAKTCKGKAFSLKVNNDARRSSLFSWTKSLSLNVPGAKVKLGQKLRTKVNGHRVKPPYFKAGVLNITREGVAITISTSIGIRVLWDGASYVEVEVPVAMKGQLCGLCGNFNGNLTDDLITSDGILAETTDLMAMSWSTGKTRQCSRRMRERAQTDPRTRNSIESLQRKRLQRQNCHGTTNELTKCELLNSTLFQPCHAVAPIDKFYKSCLLDMCECKSSRRCECDTIQAYARQCERLGISVKGWRLLSNCGGIECPHGAEYKVCAPLCRSRCRNQSRNLDCYKGGCSSGPICYCPPPTVLHRGTCIPVQECPRKGKKHHRNNH